MCVKVKYKINNNEYNLLTTFCFSSFFHHFQNATCFEDSFKLHLLCILHPVLKPNKGKYF